MATAMYEIKTQLPKISAPVGGSLRPDQEDLGSYCRDRNALKKKEQENSQSQQNRLLCQIYFK